jgi:integrase
VLRGFFSWCVERHLADRDPTADLEPAHVPSKPPEHLTVAGLRKLLDTMATDATLKRARGKVAGREVVWLADVVELAVYTGLRRGELERLRWRDVDLDALLLYVRNTARGQTKTRSERAIPLVPQAAALLQRLQGERTSEDGDAPILTSPHGGPISARVASAAFKTYVVKAGLDGITFHSLRKTTATWLASAGVPMQITQRVLGHTTVTTTERHYADVWTDDVRRELERAFSRTIPL